MKFGLIGISFLFKLKFPQVSLTKIIFFLFIPDFLYIGLSIYALYGIAQFPPVLTPSPDQWSHSLIVNGIIGGLTAVYIILDKQDRSNLILTILPALNIILNTFSIFYIIYYFYPFFENINTIIIKAYIEYNNYLKNSYGQFTSIGMVLWPFETIYWTIDLLTFLLCIIIALWRIVKSEYEVKSVVKIDEDFIIPSDYTLIHNYPKIEGLSFDEEQVFTQVEWEKLAKRLRDEIINYRHIKGGSLDFEYKYPDFKGFIHKIEKPFWQNYKNSIKKIYSQLNNDINFDENIISVNELKIPLIQKGKLFLIKIESPKKLIKQELLYIANDGFPVFINRGKPNLIVTDYTKFNDILLNEDSGLKEIIEFDFSSKDEKIKRIKRNQILSIIKQFIMLYGCFRERILYSNQDLNKWKLYDYRNPEIEYRIGELSIISIQINKLKDSIGVNLWTWSDYYSKWALIFYQFQLFADGLHPDIFPLYRIPIYSGILSQDD
ncbi:MAG: hypothetical protein ACTSRG_03955 [Candidatus Helarchaeota archaeon]